MDHVRLFHAWIGYYRMVLLHGLASRAKLKNRVHLLDPQVMSAQVLLNEITALLGPVTYSSSPPLDKYAASMIG